MNRVRTALLCALAAAGLMGCVAPPAAAPPPPPSNVEVPFDQAVIQATDALLAQVLSMPAFAQKLAKRAVVLDPMLDASSGQQTAATQLLEQRVGERLAARADTIELLPFRSANLAKAQYLLTGTLTRALADRPKGSLLVNLDATDALSSEGLAFLVGKRVAELRPDLAARTFFPTVTELATVVTTAVRVSKGERAGDAATQKSDAALTAAMTHAEAEGLRHAMRHASQSGEKLDVKRWAQLVDLTTSRAGLLLCGHVDIARRAMLHEAQAPCDLRPRERVEALCLFAISEAFGDLRRSLGLSIDKT